MGSRFAQSDAQRLTKVDHLIFVCGHYEGIDTRVREHLIDEVFSIGDYVVTGGELPAMVMVDAVVRLLPGVLGNPESLENESFGGNSLGAPCYTRPRQYQGWEVPEVLLSGHHARIVEWRDKKARELTRRHRPDLLDTNSRPDLPSAVDKPGRDR